MSIYVFIPACVFQFDWSVQLPVTHDFTGIILSSQQKIQGAFSPLCLLKILKNAYAKFQVCLTAVMTVYINSSQIDRVRELPLKAATVQSSCQYRREFMRVIEN